MSKASVKPFTFSCRQEGCMFLAKQRIAVNRHITKIHPENAKKLKEIIELEKPVWICPNDIDFETFTARSKRSCDFTTSKRSMLKAHKCAEHVSKKARTGGIKCASNITKFQNLRNSRKLSEKWAANPDLAERRFFFKCEVEDCDYVAQKSNTFLIHCTRLHGLASSDVKNRSFEQPVWICPNSLDFFRPASGYKRLCKFNTTDQDMMLIHKDSDNCPNVKLQNKIMGSARIQQSNDGNTEQILLSSDDEMLETQNLSNPVLDKSNGGENSDTELKSERNFNIVSALNEEDELMETSNEIEVSDNSALDNSLQSKAMLKMDEISNFDNLPDLTGKDDISKMDVCENPDDGSRNTSQISATIEGCIQEVDSNYNTCSDQISVSSLDSVDFDSDSHSEELDSTGWF